jgi:hypothetical protein
MKKARVDDADPVAVSSEIEANRHIEQSNTLG